MTSTIRSKRVTASKRHFCFWCGHEIKSGEECRATTLACDGIYTIYECNRCKPYVEEFYSAFYVGAFPFDEPTADDFEEWMWDQHRDTAKEWWGR